MLCKVVLGMTNEVDQVRRIDVSKIAVSAANVRGYNPDRDPHLQELADSIDKWGLLQPVALRGEFQPDAPRYELLIGQRRLAAHKLLGRDKIRAIFAGEMDDTEATIRSLTENLVRTELTRGQVQRAVAKLYDTYGSDRLVAEKTGLHIGTVRDNLNVREYVDKSPRLQQMLDAPGQKVTMQDAKRALKAAKYDIGVAEELLDKVKEQGLNPTQQARMVDLAEKRGAIGPEEVDELVAEARVPRYEQVLMVPLSDGAREALRRAAHEQQISDQELAVQIIEDWLNAQDLSAGEGLS